ncbi:MAG: AP protein [Candidatus Hydrogenedentes bacterium]|nr:AP protein [Candidatus Hydrogenedentota bacterium]
MRRLIAAGLLCLAASPAVAAGFKTENVIIMTADGIRVQEFFGGVDPVIFDSGDQAGIENIVSLRKEFWRDTPEARREALMPFLWTELLKEGILLGNPAKNSPVTVTNLHKVSYPGYAEILTGFAQARIINNNKIPNPSHTVLEFVQNEFKLGYTGVGAFGSWELFNWICAREKDPFYINAGYEAVPKKLLTPGMHPLNELQFQMLTPWDSVRFDMVTLTLGLEYLKKYAPRIFFLSLGETDDWAHNRRYDRVVQTARLFDDALKTVWETVQSTKAYRGKTTLIITGDHGRGITPEDWTSHKGTIPGSEFIWMGVFGPDTPKQGELGDTPATQSQVAATAAKFLGLDYNAAVPEAAPPVDAAFSKP